MPGLHGIEALQKLKEARPRVPVVLITVKKEAEGAIEAMRYGAYDYLSKPVDPETLRTIASQAIQASQRMKVPVIFEPAEDIGGRECIIGRSPLMWEIYKGVGRAAATGATVLITGESGTGKELVARAIYQHSTRAEQEFVTINCAAVPENLLESELFGHEKGAFTGAQQQKKGCFEMARGGTVLLDEIGSTRPDFQVKLLRVLQEGTFQRVGSGQELHADVRVIAATNRDLEKAMQEGSFLPDLYYRLNVVALRVPPLRERIEDLAALAQLFLQKYAHETKREVVGIADETLACMQAYAWPGNVRELENAIERAVVLGTEEQIEPEDLPEQILGAAAVAQEEMTAGYHASVKDYQRRLIQKTLEQTEGHQARAAEILGLQRTYLSRLIKNLGLR